MGKKTRAVMSATARARWLRLARLRLRRLARRRLSGGAAGLGSPRQGKTVMEWLLSPSSGLTAFISHPDCQAHRMGQGHPESPERIVAIRGRLAEARLFDFLQQVPAPLATEQQICRAHTPRYLEYLEGSAPAQGTKRLDSDTALCPDSLKAIRRAAGAGVAAVDMVMSGRAPNAFCCVRPPGHHAESSKAMGFCFVNNVAVAAMHALAVHRLKRVLIVDFDAHHGNGTEEIFKDDERVMLISSFQHPFFPYSGDKPIGSNPNIRNFPLPAGSDGRTFRKMVLHEWLPAIQDFRPELFLLSAGFDAHVNDGMAFLRLNDDDFGWITARLVRQANLRCEGRLVSILEGGYDVPSLAGAVARHVEALCGRRIRE